MAAVAALTAIEVDVVTETRTADGVVALDAGGAHHVLRPVAVFMTPSEAHLVVVIHTYLAIDDLPGVRKGVEDH